MAKYLECYNALASRDQIHCWPEQLCDMAGVKPGELVGAVCRAIWESKASESSMVSSIAHPEILIQTAKLAKRAANFKDRELFFRLTGSLPDKKGASINIFNNGMAQGSDLKLPEIGQVARTRLKTFDEEIIEISRDLDDEDVSS